MAKFNIPAHKGWHVVEIPKKHKPLEKRKLTIPGDELKDILGKEILKYLYSIKSIRPNQCAHGFVPYRSTLTAVQTVPLCDDTLIHFDVDNFFDTFPMAKIKEEMIRGGVPYHTADEIINAGSYKGTVPQGAPTSPYLTNIGMRRTDATLKKVAQRLHYTYIRYADDLIFTTRKIPKGVNPYGYVKRLESIVQKIINDQLGLNLDMDKTGVSRIDGWSSREVLGIVIRKDGKGYNAPRKMRRAVRAMVNNLYYKIRENNGQPSNDDHNTWNKIVGYVRYMDEIRSKSITVAAREEDPVVKKEQWEYLAPIFKTKVERVKENDGT